MNDLATANLWLLIGVCIGFALGLAVVAMLFAIDRWVGRAFEQAERDERDDAHTAFGADSVTADDTYPGGIRP